MEEKKRKRVRIRFFVLLGLIVFLMITSLSAEKIIPNDPNKTMPRMANRVPEGEYPFGTDNYGRCVFSRVMMGAKTSIFSSILLVLITSTFGTLIGLISGYYGGIVDIILMRITDVFLAFPGMVLAIAIAGVLGGGLKNAMIAISISGWTSFARIARSSTLKIKEETYIKAAILSGVGDKGIIFRYILPNILGIIVVTATLKISSMMISISGLSFLGLGVQLPKAEWGSMISEGVRYLQIAPWITFFPSLIMVLTIIIFNLFGDTVRDLLDPKH